MDYWFALITISLAVGIYIITCHLVEIKRELKNIVKLMIVIGDHTMGVKS